MLIILSGPSCVGKSFCVEFLCSRHGYRTLTPYTTRPARPSESEGLHYHFRSEADLREISAGFAVGYWAQPLDGQWYGYTNHVDELADDPGNWVVQAYSDIALAIKRRRPGATTVFLDYKTETAQRQRIAERYRRNPSELARRLKHAEHELNKRGEFDYRLESDNPQVLADDVRALGLTRVNESPPAAVVRSGPMTDVDVLGSLRAEGGIRVEGLPESDWPDRIHGWSIDLTLSEKYFRVRRQLLWHRTFDLADGSDNDMARRFHESFASPERGIRLRPNEFILGATKEKLSLPRDVVGLISGRSSYSRLGLSVELSQAILQPGHNDTVPLQIRNNLPYSVVIYPGAALAQVVFFRTRLESSQDYQRQKSAKYLGQLADIRSRYYDDPIYSAIRDMPGRKNRTDWAMVLNVLLALSTAISLLAVATAVYAPQETALVGKHAAMVSVPLLLLTGIVRVLALLRQRP